MSQIGVTFWDRYPNDELEESRKQLQREVANADPNSDQGEKQEWITEINAVLESRKASK